MSAVADGLAQVKERIEAACARARRSSNQVRLLAVSKLQPAELIRQAYAAGHREFGENYAQELRDKAVQLADLPGLVWHAIGPLQANKAKYVAKAASWFHALDRADIAAELSKRRTGEPLRCLLEINVGAESSKSGVGPADAQSLLARVRALPNLEVVGLTALPPLTGRAEDARPHFRSVAELASRLGLSELSMGTTADYEVAIEEGSTLVRVGTAIFGERPARGTVMLP